MAGGKRKELPTPAPPHTLAPGPLQEVPNLGPRGGEWARHLSSSTHSPWGSLPPHLPCTAPLPRLSGAGLLFAQGLFCPCPSQLPPCQLWPLPILHSCHWSKPQLSAASSQTLWRSGKWSDEGREGRVPKSQQPKQNNKNNHHNSKKPKLK